ncbi:DUF5302 domain-containing protein [Okibacterium endophyticum]
MSSDETAGANEAGATPTGTGASEETKRKFREALERKKRQSRGTGEAHLDGGSAINHTQGPADHSREFRRKSG